MARLYADENLPRGVVLALRELGHDVLTTNDAGRSNASIPDEDVVRFAHSMGRIVVTLNRQYFIRLHKSSIAQAGIVVCTVDHDHVALAKRIDAAVAGGNLEGELVRVRRCRAAEPAGSAVCPEN